MKLGLIVQYYADIRSGYIVDEAGLRYKFSYSDGQNMALLGDMMVPQFSGHHDQMEGFALKFPEKGDVVVFNEIGRGLVGVWGYATHYVDLARRRYGTSSATGAAH